MPAKIIPVSRWQFLQPLLALNYVSRQRVIHQLEQILLVFPSELLLMSDKQYFLAKAIFFSRRRSNDSSSVSPQWRRTPIRNYFPRRQNSHLSHRMCCCIVNDRTAGFSYRREIRNKRKFADIGSSFVHIDNADIYMWRMNMFFPICTSKLTQKKRERKNS